MRTDAAGNRLAWLALIAGLLTLWLGLLAGAGIFALAAFSPRGDLVDGTIAGGTVAGLGLVGVPVARHAWRRRHGGAPQPWRVSVRAGAWASILALLAIVVGSLLLRATWLRPWAVVPASLLAIALPALALVAFAVGGQTGLSRMRAWAHLAFGVWGSTTVALLVEVVLAALAAGLVAVVLGVTAPMQLRSLAALVQDAARGGAVEPLLEWALRPWAVLLMLFGFGLVVPVVEEFAKSIGVLLYGRRLTPSTGFASGVLAGVGFALAESLGNLAGAGDAWLFAVVTRMATLVMHGFATGLVGWGLGQRSWRRALPALGGAVAVHGAWNVAVVVVLVLGLLFARGASVQSQIALGAAFLGVGVVLVALLLACTGGLIWLGRSIRSIC